MKWLLDSILVGQEAERLSKNKNYKQVSNCLNQTLLLLLSSSFALGFLRLDGSLLRKLWPMSGRARTFRSIADILHFLLGRAEW